MKIQSSKIKSQLQTPLFWDLHIHGAAGVDFMHTDSKSVIKALKILKSNGIGFIAPTLLTATSKQFSDALLFWGNFLKNHSPRSLEKQGAAIPIGLHLEGPFLNPEASGAHPRSQLKNPSLALLKTYIKLSQNQIAILTIAPELKGASEVISFCKKYGIRVQIGHTTANAELIEKARKLGAQGFTHLFNAMRISHRNPAALKSLQTGKMTAELITDCVHVDSSFLLFTINSLKNSLFAVSDACSGTTLGDVNVEIKTNRDHLKAAYVYKTQTLAGGASFLTEHPEYCLRLWKKSGHTIPNTKSFFELFYKTQSELFPDFKKYYKREKNAFSRSNWKCVNSC